MKVVTTNLLNRLWKKGIEPIIDDLTGKLNKSKVIESTNITEPGFVMDGKTASEELSNIHNILSDLNISKSFTKDNITIPAEGYLSIDIPLEIPEGYKTRSLGSISILNATSSGANSSRCFYYTNTWSGSTATVAVRNTSAAAAKIKVIVRMEFTKIL